MNDFLFVTAQPDKPYFHWQVSLYVHNFIKLGIKPIQINVLFAMVEGNETPSKEANSLKDLGINIFFYKDDREDKSYIPSIKPYLIWKWLEEFPEKGKLLFLHDSDIIFTKEFNVSHLLDDNIIYLSNTLGYLSYNYILECSERYSSSHPNSEKIGLIKEMCEVIGIDSETVKKNNDNSGGGQYILKNMDSQLWYKIYKDCTPLYKQMLNYDSRHPINNGQIQFWTAEMWSIIWNLWLHNFETKISDDLSFCWATDHIEAIKQNPILHMAGVTYNLKDIMFFKGEFIEVNPIEKLIENPNIFDYVNTQNASFFYIENMKDYIKKGG